MSRSAVCRSAGLRSAALRSACLLACLVLAFAPACKSREPAAVDGPLQTERDESLRYELLDPADHEFLVTYELCATTPGARAYLTPVRGDTFVSDVSALDLDTGKKLDVGLVAGKVARERGHPAADPEGSYFLVVLDRPVPAGGDVRLRVQVKYEDRTSYSRDGANAEFQRLLAVRNVTVVLPKGHVLVDVNQPVELRRLDDGRISASYSKRGHAPVPLRVRLTALPEGVELPALKDWTKSGNFAELRTNRPLVRRTSCELVDPVRGEMVWRHELVLEEEGGTCSLQVPGELVDARALDLTTGKELPVRREETDLVIDDVSVIAQPVYSGVLACDVPARAEGALSGPRVVVETRVREENVHVIRTNELELDARHADVLVLPPGWRVLENDQAASVRLAADGSTELEFARDARLHVRAWLPPETR